MQTTELFIFRHGETDWNREGRFQGHRDIPLNKEGIRQARNLVETMKRYMLDAIVTSDLLRAKATAEILNETLNLPFVVTPELRECTLGDSEGMPREKLIEKYGESAWQRWLSVKPEDHDFCFPNGESKAEHLLRLKNYLEKFCYLNSQYKRIGVSTHGGGVRRLIHSCENAPIDPVPLPNCVLYHVKFDHQSSKWIFLGRVD